MPSPPFKTCRCGCDCEKGATKLTRRRPAAWYIPPKGAVNDNDKYREPYDEFGYPPEKEKPVCSSENALSREDLRLVRLELDAAVKRRNAAPQPDPAERAKEREHEAAMHKRECERHTNVCNTITSELWPVLATLAAAATVCFIAYQIRAANTPIPKASPTPTAEQMFGMGGK